MNAVRCPVCDSDDIEAGDYDGDANSLWETCSCSNCESEWINVYKIISQEVVRFEYYETTMDES